MKKRRVSRLLLILAVTIAMIAATAVVASAATINKNDADYKYSKTLEDGTVVSFTRDLINEPVATDYIQCKIQLREGDEFGNYPFFGLTYSKRLPNQEWDKNGTVAYGVLNIEGSNLKQGMYSLTCNGDGWKAYTIDFFYANFQKATKMMITTYPDKILFNADCLTRDQHGEYTNVFVKGHNFDAMLKNGWGEWMATKAPSTMKPGKKYALYAGQIDRVNNHQVNSKVYKLATVTMGPSTKPVIKSVKISNVKVKRYFSYNEGKYRYKTTFTMTVTLSKMAKGAKGIDLTTSVNGISSYKTLKGTKNTYTANFNWDMPMSLKGKTVSVKVKTYNDTKYKAYSYDSKAKKAKI